MKVFFRLLLAHLLTDFTIQTNFIARWKKQSFLGVVVHSAAFFILAFILTFSELNKIWFEYPIKLPGYLCLLILFILHVIEDEYRAYNVRHYHIQDTLLFFLWDQIIHVVFLYVFSPYREFSFEPWVIVACLFIVGTHGLSVVLLYLDIMIYNKQTAYDKFNKRQYPIIFCFIILLIFLLPDKWFVLSFLLIPISLFVYNKFNIVSPLGRWIYNTVPYVIGICNLCILGKI